MKNKLTIAQQQVTCADCSSTGDETACSNLPAIVRADNFTCNLSAPDGFAFSPIISVPNNTRLVVDLNCLHCFAEPCICTTATGNPTRFAVRVVDCIPFIVNQRIVLGPNHCRLLGFDTFVCYSDSVYVDNTICFACSEVTDIVSYELIRRNLTCSGIFLSTLSLTPCYDNPALATIAGT